MFTFRFETYENVITKHTLPKVHWTQAAQWAFLDKTDKRDWSIARVKQLDKDTVEIIKRRDVNKSLCYKLGFDQQGVYERVIVNRKDQSVAIDRMDINWLTDGPFLGMRDLFYPSTRGGEGASDFVRHHYWLHKLCKPCAQMGSHFSAWSFKRAFRSKDTVSRKQ